MAYSSKEYIRKANQANREGKILNIRKDNLFLDDLPSPNFEELKIQKLIEAKIKVEEFFYSNYPEYKQRNIAIFGTEEEKNKFKDFHNLATFLYDSFIGRINDSKNIESLNIIKLEFSIPEGENIKEVLQ